MRLKTKFQDEDFDLGEVVEGVIVECLGKHEEELRVIATAAKGGQHIFYYSSIKKFMDDWEDVPEEEVWYLGEEIGNYALPKEEARKITKKILAWKRLKGHNLRIERGQRIFVNADNKLTSQKTLFVVDTYEEVEDDLDLLFGGEE